MNHDLIITKIRSGLTNIQKIAIVLFITLMIVMGYTPSVKADVIYQAFDIPFQEIKNQLPQLKANGFTYIQVSPPEKSNPSDQWWARYQPVDFTVIESRLGNENDLKELINAAHEQGLKILVDVVLNHMANASPYVENLQYPRFSRADFHPRGDVNDNNCPTVTNGWLGGNLPDLNTSSPYVQGELRNYLTKLLDLGVDGFRVDAIKHIAVADARNIFEVVPSDKYIYGEIIGATCNEYSTYPAIHNIDITDYGLLGRLKTAFSLGGDLRSLINPQGVLPGTIEVTFSKTHDTIPRDGRCEGLCQGYNFDSRDQMLANAYLLARQDGLPLIYLDDGNDPIVRAGANFHEKLLAQRQNFRNGKEIANGGNSPNLLFIERGNQGIAMINKAGEPFVQSVARMPGLEEGCYQESVFDFTMCVGRGRDGQKYVTQWGSPDKGGLEIPARSALFFVKKS